MNKLKNPNLKNKLKNFNLKNKLKNINLKNRLKNILNHRNTKQTLQVFAFVFLLLMSKPVLAQEGIGLLDHKINPIIFQFIDFRNKKLELLNSFNSLKRVCWYVDTFNSVITISSVLLAQSRYAQNPRVARYLFAVASTSSAISCFSNYFLDAKTIQLHKFLFTPKK